jgi:hypothetical protein
LGKGCRNGRTRSLPHALSRRRPFNLVSKIEGEKFSFHYDKRLNDKRRFNFAVYLELLQDAIITPCFILMQNAINL